MTAQKCERETYDVLISVITISEKCIVTFSCVISRYVYCKIQTTLEFNVTEHLLFTVTACLLFGSYTQHKLKPNTYIC